MLSCYSSSSNSTIFLPCAYNLSLIGHLTPAPRLVVLSELHAVSSTLQLPTVAIIVTSYISAADIKLLIAFSQLYVGQVH